jgi:hypothetical protein
MNELFQRLSGATARIEGMWPFPMFNAPEKLIEAIADRLDGDNDLSRLPEPMRPFFAGLSEDELDSIYDGGFESTELMDYIAGNMFDAGVGGFLALAATPVMESSKGGGVHYSWGYYRLEFFFGNTAEDVVSQVCDWAEKNYEDAKAKAA